MSDDYDFENELAKSIANIVEEETNEAEDYVRNTVTNAAIPIPNTSNLDPMIESEEFVEDQDDDDELKDKTGTGDKRTLMIIIASVIGAILVIGIAAFFIVTAAINHQKDNYTYNYTKGFEARADKDYETAIEYFEKAYTYDEGKKDTSMMLYMYECYTSLEEDTQAENILQDVLAIEPSSYEALYYLVKLYEEQKNYEGIAELYDTIRDSSNDKIIALFATYAPAEPIVSPNAGTFNSDQKISFSVGGDVKIYYTTDGSDPTTDSSLYDNAIEIKEGTTTIKYISVNEYGVKSDIYEAKYEITYTAPSAPTITPDSGQYSTSSEQMIAITDIPDGGTAYYTTDGSTPTKDSTEYTAPFPMATGSSVISVIVVDKNGLTSSVATAVYKLEIVEKYSDTDAEEFIWAALEAKKIVNNKHEDKDGNECTIGYYSKKTINDKVLWMYTITLGDKDLDYWYGVDANTGNVYKISGSEGSYTLAQVSY